MPLTYSGTIHGRMIELEGETALPDGAKVRVSVEAVNPLMPLEQAQALLLETAGGWSDVDDAEFSRWMEMTRQGRESSHRDEFMKSEN